MVYFTHTVPLEPASGWEEEVCEPCQCNLPLMDLQSTRAQGAKKKAHYGLLAAGALVLSHLRTNESMGPPNSCPVAFWTGNTFGTSKVANCSIKMNHEFFSLLRVLVSLSSMLPCLDQISPQISPQISNHH